MIAEKTDLPGLSIVIYHRIYTSMVGFKRTFNILPTTQRQNPLLYGN